MYEDWMDSQAFDITIIITMNNYMKIIHLDLKIFHNCSFE